LAKSCIIIVMTSKNKVKLKFDNHTYECRVLTNIPAVESDLY
jgi:hypothetical protein